MAFSTAKVKYMTLSQKCALLCVEVSIPEKGPTIVESVLV